MSDPIRRPEMDFDKNGIWLSYWGWRDSLSGHMEFRHSNDKEDRIWNFRCTWPRGECEVERTVRAKSKDPDHTIKGTASSNRKDIEEKIRDEANRWRGQKLGEQNILRQLMNGPEAKAITVVGGHFITRPRECTAFWLRQALLLEPEKFARNCKTGWIEVLPVGEISEDAARFVAKTYADGGDEEKAIELAQQGLSATDIERVLNEGN